MKSQDKLGISNLKAMDDAQKDTLQKIIDGAGSEGMVAAAKKAMQFLEDEHLMYKLHLKCSLLGVYEGNHSGMGIDLAHLQQLMESIAAVGYVDHGGRICVELDSTSPESENTRQDAQARAFWPTVCLVTGSTVYRKVFLETHSV